MFWVLFFLGLAFADKLDRTYLPPPGSKFSGGSPGVIQVPLEDAKSLYPSSNGEYFTTPEIAIGIDRVPSKLPIGINSQPHDPSIDPENTYIASTTVNPYQKNSFSPSNNGYSTVKPNYISNYSKDTLIPDNPKNSYKNQARYPSDSNEDKFQTTESYPLEKIPIDIRGKDYYGILTNQSDFSNTGIPQSSPTPQLVTGIVNKEYNPNQYFSSSIPSVNVNNNVVSSTTPPSTINYNYETTTDPTQFYSSTSQLPQYSTAIPIGSKNSQIFNYPNIKKRPERPQAQADREAVILNYESSITPEGYSYTYDTSNGIHGDENGVTVNGVRAKGSYSYIGDDGKLYSVVYTADENGFRPQGEHLPTSPPIPDAILKVIEQVTKEKEAGIVDDGSYDDNKYGYRKYHNGFYTPKKGFNKLNSNMVKDQGFIQNMDNTPFNRGGIRNEVADKTYKETNIFPNSIGTQNVISGYDNKIRSQIGNKDYKGPSEYPNLFKNQNNTPKIDKLNYYGNNLEQQSGELYNNSGIKGTEIDDLSDLEIKSGTNNKSNSNLSKQSYNKLVTDNQVRQSNNQTVGNFGITGEGINDSTNVYKTEELIAGYHYNPPQYTINNQFPSRFSDFKTELETTRQENIKMTPKPFLTPYVRSEDEIQNYDNYGKPLKYPETEYYEDLNEDTNDNILYSGDDLDQNDGYNKTDFYNDQYESEPLNVYQSEDSKVNDQAPQNIQGYFYQQGGTDTDIPNNKFIADPHSYTSSTAPPTEFTTRINTKQSKESKDPKFSSEKQILIKSKSGVPSTTYLANAFPKQFSSNNYSTVKPGFIDQNGASIPAGSTNVHPDIDYNTTPRYEHSTSLPVIGNSYSPNLDISHADEYNHPATVKGIGEDFTGPKQQSRFDPLTGYYY